MVWGLCMFVLKMVNRNTEKVCGYKHRWTEQDFVQKRELTKEGIVEAL